MADLLRCPEHTDACDSAETSRRVFSRMICRYGARPYRGQCDDLEAMPSACVSTVPRSERTDELAARFARLVAALPRCSRHGCERLATYEVTDREGSGAAPLYRCDDHLADDAADLQGLGVERLPWADLLPTEAHDG